MSTDNLKKLREPFPPNQISTLPRPLKKDSPKGRCQECGGWHGLPAIHLSYVGHAALTDRLLDTDPMWTWEPLSMNDGLPVMDTFGGMWIKLTVCGVTRLGYGHAGDKQGGDAIKEVIGDALRNAAMRFGAALELWHKGQLHEDQEEGERKEGFDIRGTTTVAYTDSVTTSDPWAVFKPAESARIRAVGQVCIQAFNEGKEWSAFEEYTSLLDKAKDNDFRNNVILALWDMWKPHSALRAYIKKAEQDMKNGAVKETD